MAKVKFTHVPFKGSGAALVDLVGGQVHLMFDQISSGAHHIKAGKLRPIAVTTLTRSKFLPDTPTIDESGLKGFESSTYTTLAIPAATPAAAVQKLRDGVVKSVAQPKVREAFEKLGAEVVTSTPEDLVEGVHARDGVGRGDDAPTHDRLVKEQALACARDLRRADVVTRKDHCVRKPRRRARF